MSDKSDWHTYREGRQARSPSGTSERDPGLRGSKPGLLKTASWSSRVVAGLRGNSVLSLVRRHVLLTVILFLVLVPLGALLLGYITRPAPGKASQAAGLSPNSSDNSTGDKIAKPPAGKPLLSSSQAPVPVLSSQGPAPALPNQPPAGLTGVPARPLAPPPGVPNPAPNPALPPPAAGTAARPPYTPMVYSARHEKHFGDSCAGQLTLDSSGLTFRCGDDPRGSVQVALADIQSVDSNGIRLISGKKYHFSIAGMGKDSEQALFSDWLSRVR